MAALTETQKVEIEIDEAWHMFCETGTAAETHNIAELYRLDPTAAKMCKLAFQSGYIAGTRNQLAASMEGSA